MSRCESVAEAGAVNQCPNSFLGGIKEDFLGQGMNIDFEISFWVLQPLLLDRATQSTMADLETWTCSFPHCTMLETDSAKVII